MNTDMMNYDDDNTGGNGAARESGDDDVASAASTGRNADEVDSIEISVSSDREAVREGLYESAVARQAEAAAGDGEVGFGKQMVQLALIPALIVGAVMGVWLLMTTLTGQQQSIDSILSHLEAVPRLEGGGGVADIPNRQEVFREALVLAGVIEGETMTAEVREKVRARLEALAERHRGGDPDFLAFIMKALGTIANAKSIPVFEMLLKSTDADDQYAALLGLYNWQERGDMTATRPLTGDVIALLQSNNDRIPVMAAAVLAGVADPSDMVARDALAEVVDRAGPDNREEVWNAGCALAALGDARGIGVVLALLDRKWLSEQADLDHPESGRKLSEASQDKLMKTVLNILVRFVPGKKAGDGETKSVGHFVVRVDNDKVWARVKAIAADDPSDSVRAIAKEVLRIRDGSGE